MLRYGLFSSRHGWMGALSSQEGLLRTTLPQPTPDRALEELGPHASQAIQDDASFADLFHRLELFFDGKPVAFPEALDPAVGTLFQRAVWDAACTIPYGQTRSYGWIAQQVKRPRASRAVGQAMGANPIPIVVPCHRVIGADGRLCGYGDGGPAVKQRLLDLEMRAADR